MNRPDVIRVLGQFARASAARAQLQSLADLIEGGASYELYRTVSEVKARLSVQPEAQFFFRAYGVNIESTIRRSDFETWIGGDRKRIDACVDEVLATTRLKPHDIDRVFLTGDTFYVPAVRQLFSRRFGDERIETGEQLLSIAKGLALIGESKDIFRWKVP